MKQKFAVVFLLMALFIGLAPASAAIASTSPVIMGLDYSSFSDTLNRGMSGQYNRNYGGLFILFGILAVVLACYVLLRAVLPDANAKKAKKSTDAPPAPQNRSFVRLDVDLPFQYIWLSDEDDSELEYQSARTVDISGGGFGFGSDNDIKTGQRLRVSIPLPGGPQLDLVGQVVRILNRSDNYGNNHIVAVEFVNIREGERERIVNWIFKYQRETIEEKNTPAQEDLNCLLCGSPLPPQQPGQPRILYCRKCQLRGKD